MRTSVLLLALLAGATHSGALLNSIPPTPPLFAFAAASVPDCHLNVFPDYTLGFAYQAFLQPSSDCLFTVSLRVRKTSTISRKRNGAPYQPIIPDGSARYGGVYSWTLGKYGGTVPRRELWTSYSWKWQWLDGEVWRDGVEP
ncbi:hypothetical protein [Deinococcus marmoris]|uniref:Ecp2 effector protein domain-containing protein n=1 Tax=Deinococcus marmoris TaxID=249408 RepID=A0A1U7P4L6_9DEIO|nr:hypothetical protein [Deinococcus marmoris]OLV20117.1 hypothetical protein BOO71_0000379 [Deinococcus marmoris]